MLLVLYLLVMEFVVGHNVQKAYNQVRDTNRSRSEFYTLDRLERLSVDLKDARDNQSKAPLSAESLQNAQNIMEMLGRLPSVTSTQKSQLKDCIPPPSDVTRNEKLDRCLQMIEGTRQAALEAAAGATSAQVAGESANRINEHRMSLHTFWIQAAQLILLNLLLPLLTALFGYIFGTQQAQRSSN